MGQYKRKDSFYKKAKSEGHVSRSYYKIEQIQKKYQVMKRGSRVIDLGCAPGGWLEYASGIVGKEGLILGLDLLPIKINQRENILYFQQDINDEATIDLVKEKVSAADLVMSDMAPDISGVKFRDSFLSYELALEALEIAKQVLKKGGNFVTKIFPGEEFAGFKKELSNYFNQVKQYRPEATRKSSIEVYLIGLSYKGK